MSVSASTGTTITNTNRTPNDLKAIGNTYRENNKLYNETKQRLTNLQSESEVLQRTEQELQQRFQSIEENLKQNEDNAGVTGYRKIQNKLELASEDTAESDEIKGQMLEEISETIKNIQSTLHDKQNVLKPKIDIIKNLRKEISKFEQGEYLEVKNKYDKVSRIVNNEKQVLMKECEGMKNNWIDEERQYYYLLSMNEILESKIKKVKKEDEIMKLPSSTNDNGSTRPESSSLVESYKEKLTQQESLGKQLRIKKRDIMENETTNLHQRAMFSDLKDLLNCKMMSNKQQQQEQDHNGDDISSNELLSEAMHIGGAQIISFD